MSHFGTIKMYFDEHNDNNDHNDHQSNHHETYRHSHQDDIPPSVQADAPQLSGPICCHTCRSECQSSQDIGAGDDEGGGRDADGNVFCGPCTLRLNGVEALDDTSDADSLQGDKGLPRHQVEFPNLEHDWIEVAGQSLPLADIFVSLAQYFAGSCRRVGILPSPDGFSPAMFSPMASGIQTPSPSESMIVQAPQSGRQSLSTSVYISRVASDPSLINHAGAFESAFPPLANFHRGPLWMGPEPMPRR